MKRKKSPRKLITIIAISILVIGIVFSSVILGSYYFYQKDIDETINEIDNRISSVETPTTTSRNSEKNTVESDGDNSDTGDSPQSDGYVYYSNNDRRQNNVDVNRLREASLKYNEALKSIQSSKLVGEKSYTYAALDLTQYGIYDNIYGYVSAPAIDMELPIYLGVTEGNMAYGAAHFCYTSLPTGGESTNVVLAGHTGYIGRWLFDSIRYLDEGDEVNVKTYIGSLSYKVVDKKIKFPKESEDIFIDKGKDKLTLTTCIYDSEGNYKRCIVICERKQ